MRPLSPSPLPRLGLLRCPTVGICAGRLEPHQGRERQPRGGDRELRGERVRQAFWGKADAGQGIKGRDSGRGRHQLPPGPQGQEWIHHGQLPSHRAGEALAPFQESHFLQTPSFLDPYFLSLSFSVINYTFSCVSCPAFLNKIGEPEEVVFSDMNLGQSLGNCPG